jgi:hypothetical protein
VQASVLARSERLLRRFVVCVARTAARWNYEARALVFIPSKIVNVVAFASWNCIGSTRNFKVDRLHAAAAELTVIDARKALGWSKPPIARIARVRHDDGRGKHGNVVAVAVSTPKPVQDVFTGRAIDAKACHVALRWKVPGAREAMSRDDPWILYIGVRNAGVVDGRLGRIPGAREGER